MKKYGILLTLIIISGVLLLTQDALAASCSGVETAIIECTEGGDGGIYHMLSLVLEIMSAGIGILGVLGIVIAGTQYMTAGGDTTRTAKAKRRLLEIVIGLACYAVFFGLTEWLSPDGGYKDDYTGVESVSISYNKKVYVGDTFVPNVTFNQGATDTTYTLKSASSKVAKASGMGVKCLSEGKTEIQVISANSLSSSMSIECLKPVVATPTKATDNSDSKTTGSMANTKLKNGKTRLREETDKIINDHRTDFYSKNYLSKIKKAGGYKKYVASLGGVFGEHIGDSTISVKTAADFQEAAEYIFGLWTIWGPDYSSSGAYHSWRGGSSWNGGKNDGFYNDRDYNYRRALRYQYGSINQILSNAGTHSIDTVCSTAVSTFVSSTSLKSFGRIDYSSQSKSSVISQAKGTKITKVNNLQVGDIVHFFNGSNIWVHVAMVGEVYKDYVVLYDGGSMFMNSGTYKHKTKRVNGSKLTNDYSSFGDRWVAFRPWNIDQSVTLKGIN